MFSIIIPTYNSAKRVITAINSVLNQTFQTFEVIVVDDGSTDDTEEVMARMNDERIKYLYKPNGGPASARNLGIRHARYDRICFLDADDEYEPQKLELTMSVLHHHPNVDVIFTDAIYINETSHEQYKFSDTTQIHTTSIKENLLKNNFIINSTVVLNKNRLLEFDLLFDEDPLVKFVEDYDLWLKLAMRDVKFYYINEPLTKYYIHGNNSSSNAIRTYRSLKKVLGNYVGQYPSLLYTLFMLESKIIIRSVQRLVK